MQETREPAGIVSAIITGSAFGLVSYFLSQGLEHLDFGGRFQMEELVVLGAMLGVILHLFGKIRSGHSYRAEK